MKLTLKLKKHWTFYSFFIVLLSVSLQIDAQTILAEWTFDNDYDQSGTGPYTYTPNATARSAADGLDISVNSNDIFYPNTAEGTLTDYEMSMTPSEGGQIKNVYQGTTTYHNSARMQGAISPADFTNPSNHANYFQFSFPTTGYNQITLDLSYTTQNVETDILDVYYSVDGGTSWASAGQASGNCCWWTLKTAQLDIVAKNKSNVLVRLMGVQDGGSTGNYFYIDSFKVSGTSTTLPTDTVSTIDWAFDLGTEGQTATYTDASYYKPDNVSKGSNYSYFGTRTGSNPTVTYTSFKNETGATTPAGAEANNLIGFEFTPVTGLDFVPTNVSFDCQRYGTGTGVIDVYWKSSDGTSTLIAKDIKPARDGDATSEANDTNTFNMDVSGLSIPALGGKSTLEIYIHSLGNGKEVALANISITGHLNGTIADVAQYTVTTAASPSEGGAIISDNPATVDDGTVVNLTANANFGYEFVEWQDDLGATVSTDNPFQITVTDNVSYTAVFNQLTTYELSLTVEGGANDYMIEIAPSGTMVDGKRMYEAGTNVTLTASSNPILNFSNWGTGETNGELIVTMDDNKAITANYNAADYIVGWDFYDDVITVDFSSNVINDATTLVLRDAAGTTTNGLNFSYVSGNSWYGKNCRINWQGLEDKFYYQIKINATDYTDISVQAAMLISYSGYTVQKCEYSIDGTNFVEIGTYDTSTINTWVDGSFNLPADANNQAEVYIRWIPDYTSAAVGSGNDGTSISDIYVYGTESVFNDGTAPVLTSSVPANNATGASATGKVILNFDERVKIADNTTATLNGENLTPVVFGESISFEYSGLDYNTTYTFDLVGNVISDLADNTLTDAISISFTTLDKPTVTKRAYDFIVGVDGDFAAALAAADAAKNSGNRFYIFFPNGDYDLGTTTGDATQQTFIGLPNISFIGQSTEGVTLFNNPTQAQEGIDKTPTINFTSNADNIYMQDLTLLNKMDYRLGIPEKRAVALRHQGDKNIFKNVRLLSNQDTYFTGAGRTYWENGEIHGTVDYIFGDGDVFFNECLMYMENRASGGGGIVTAAATSSDWGYVFNNCTIDGDAQQDGIYLLGRPWNNAPKVVYINTIMNKLPTAGAWGDPMNVVPNRFAEYKSLTSSGIEVDLSQRRTDYTKDATSVTLDPTLDEAEAAQYTIQNVLAGEDAWQPKLATEQAEAPELSISESVLTWNNSDYVLGWAIFKDDVFMDFVTTNSYDISGTNSGIFSVRAANGMGGLSIKSNEFDASTLGLDENSLALKKLVFSPNPTSDIINIKIGGAIEKTQLSLYTITGQLLWTNKVETGNNKTISVSLQQFSKGMYLLNIERGSAKRTLKVSKL
ncbi:pectinesterase family protein [Flavobacteriaceae bacterium GSB9]|nr:pectinesterase family protein [Flavobacteriaceae bacterium GSB9]